MSDTPEFVFRESGDVRDAGESSREHVVGTDYPDDALCGDHATGSRIGALDERMNNASNIYETLDENVFVCDKCANALLDRLGLPPTPEEANEKLGREVF